MILFGTGIEGEKFYWRHKRDIDFVVDNKRGHCFHSLKCYTLEEAKDKIKGKLIVVATSRNTYVELREVLKGLKLREYIDFIWSNIYGKKLAIFYGNCHIGAISHYFSKNYYFTKEYAILDFHVNESKPSNDYPLEADLRYASLVVMHDIREENKLRIPGAKYIEGICSDSTKLIVVPNLWGMNFLWPQVTEKRSDFAVKLLGGHFGTNAIIKEMCNSEEEFFEKKDMVVGLLEYKDEFIERNITKSTKDLAYSIEKDDIYSEEIITTLFNNAIKKLKQREKQCTIKISDYIIAHVADEQLFYDEGHPHENIIIEKARRILKLLNIPREGEERCTFALDSIEIFVYGCTKRALGIVWEKKHIRCKNSKYTLDGHELSLEDFINTYKIWNQSNEMYIDTRDR